VSDLGHLYRKAYTAPVGRCPSPVTLRVDGFLTLRPCGKCVSCHANKRDALIGRCVLEAAHAPSIVVTLTLNDAALNNGTDWQSADEWRRQFINLRRRLQKNWGGSIKFRAVAERGEKFHRPHAHVMLFGVPSIMMPLKQLTNKTVWFWQHGTVTIDNVTPKAARYVCSYLTDGDKSSGVIISRASPGIGIAGFKRYLSDMKAGLKKVGAKYKTFPDPETGFLQSAAFEVDFKKYPMDATFRRIATEKPFKVLEPRTQIYADAGVGARIVKDMKAGGPLPAQHKRDEEAARQIRRAREVKLGRDAENAGNVVTINGYQHKLRGPKNGR